MSSSTDIPVGRIGRPHGIRGEVTVVPEAGDRDRFVAGVRLHTGTGTALQIRAARPYRDRGLIVAFDGIPDRTAAEGLRGATLFVDASQRRSLDPDEWRVDGLIGLRAVDETGGTLGVIGDVEEGVAQDRLVVITPAGERVSVPFVDELVDDPAGGVIVMRPPRGLFPEE